MITEKVEVGFDLTTTGGPFLVLDDAVQGQLDNADWVLGGTLFYDITDDVRSIQISRGKTAEFDTFPSGEAVVELNNRLRTYDPTYVASPFYGNIVPKREVRISANNIVQYNGVIDDWNLDYSTNGEAIATFVASDGFVYINNQTLAASTATVQTSGARVAAVLDDPAVAWPATKRQIDTGVATLGADVIADNTNVLTYLQLVESSEFGKLFISKSGDLVFQDRTVVPSSVGVVHLADDGTGISYQNMTVVYGSEQLHNEIVVSSVITESQVTAIDSDSQNAYGIFNLTLSDLLMNTDAQVENLASYLAFKYSQPEFRFDSVEVRVNNLTTDQQTAVLGLELGDVVKITFTPSGIPPAIVKYAEIIRADHDVDITGEHIMSLGFTTLDYGYLVLDDPAFGRLDQDNALGF